MNGERPRPMLTAGWTRARVGQVCGSCGTRMTALDPVRRLLSGTYRCVDCAQRLLGETPPADLDAPPLPAPPSTTRPLQPFVERMRRQLPLLDVDVKARAAGERHEDDDDPRSHHHHHKRRR